MKLYQYLKEEKEKISIMDRQQRVSYFNTYYCKPVIVSALLVFMVFSLGIRFVAAKFEKTVISGAVINVGNTSILDNNIKNCFGIEDGYELITGMDIDFTVKDNTSLDYSNGMAVLARVSSGDLDFMVLNETALRAFGYEDMYLETVNLTEKGIAGGLSLTADDGSDIYFVLIENGRNIENGKRFINYMLKEKSL